jgi:hypothetical protein
MKRYLTSLRFTSYNPTMEYNTQKRPYKFTARKWDHRGNQFTGEIVIHAYDRAEAIEQFKETRLELQYVPIENNVFRPLGGECEFWCEPA